MKPTAFQTAIMILGVLFGLLACNSAGSPMRDPGDSGDASSSTDLAPTDLSADPDAEMEDNALGLDTSIVDLGGDDSTFDMAGFDASQPGDAGGDLGDGSQQNQADAVDDTTGPPLVGGCIASDNGAGTVTLPAPCEYITADVDTTGKLVIYGGLPTGAQILMQATIANFSSATSEAGGLLGGDRVTFSATITLTMAGSGALAGFNRQIAIPVAIEFHTAARTPGDPIQLMSAQLQSLSASKVGDPDFSSLKLTAGNAFGLSSPGSVTLIKLSDGTFNVESAFVVSYKVEYQGAPGGQLDGLSGSNTGQVTITHPNCGNGRKNADEECDDGDSDDTNACSNSCRIVTP